MWQGWNEASLARVNLMFVASDDRTLVSFLASFALGVKMIWQFELRG